MNIGKVVGSVVCTVKTPTLEGIKLLVVRQIVNGQEKGLIIACDGTRQAGIGDVVYMIGRKEAALSCGNGLGLRVLISPVDVTL